MALSDTQTFSGITATTSPFQLFGGTYALSIVAGGGSWTLKMLMPDGVTYTSVVAFNGAGVAFVEQDLPAGLYECVLSGTDTGSDIVIVRIR